MFVPRHVTTWMLSQSVFNIVSYTGTIFVSPFVKHIKAWLIIRLRHHLLSFKKQSYKSIAVLTPRVMNVMNCHPWSNDSSCEQM